MNEETKNMLYETLRQDRSVKYRNVGIGAIVIGILLGGYTLLILKNTRFAMLSLVCFAFAAYALINAKQFEKKFPRDSIDFLRRVVVGKTYDKSTSGRVGHLKFEDGYDYTVHPLKGKLYDATNIGDVFFLAVLKKTGEVLVVQLDKAAEHPVMVQRGQQITQIPKSDVVPGFSPAMRSILNGDDAPIIVCDLLHKIQFANTAARNFFDRKNMTSVTLFEIFPPETVVAVQKELAAFSGEDHSDAPADVSYEDRLIRLCPIRDDDDRLTGYSAKIQ